MLVSRRFVVRIAVLYLVQHLRDMLQDYLDEFQTLCTETKKNLQTLRSQDGDTSSLVAKVDADIREMNVSLHGLESEIREVGPGPERKAHVATLNKCKTDMQGLQREWLLVVQGSSCVPAATREKAIRAVEKHDRGSAQLKATRSLAADTEAIGDSVMYELYQQREAIERIQGGSTKIGSNLDESNATLSRMDTYSNKFWRWWNKTDDSNTKN